MSRVPRRPKVTAVPLAVLTSQRDWAKLRSLTVDEHGYLADYTANLRAPLSPAALAAFDRGSGSELKRQGKSAAKMCALHSSSALAVNVFDFWTDRDLGRVVSALGMHGTATGLEFEAKLPTGAAGSPPHLDVLLHLKPSGILGVESKFTEWMTPTGDRAASLAPYISRDASFWSRAGLPAAHRLACDMATGKEKFQHLDAPQLLKHALGLARAAAHAGDWQLRYVYFDAACAAQPKHAKELGRFEEIAGAELRFRSATYQSLVAALGPAQNSEESNYFVYLHDRYFGRGDASG